MTPGKPSLSVRLHIEAIGEPVTGLWCPTCKLPSRVTQIVAFSIANGSPDLRLLSHCNEHSNGVVTDHDEGRPLGKPMRQED